MVAVRHFWLPPPQPQLVQHPKKKRFGVSSEFSSASFLPDTAAHLRPGISTMQPSCLSPHQWRGSLVTMDIPIRGGEEGPDGRPQYTRGVQLSLVENTDNHCRSKDYEEKRPPTDRMVHERRLSLPQGGDRSRLLAATRAHKKKKYHGRIPL